MAKSVIIGEREHEIMSTLWELEQATCKQVHRSLAADPPVKEVTVRTMLRKMEAKGWVMHRVEGRTFVYRPLLECDNVRDNAIRTMLSRFFDGSVKKLMSHMVRQRGLSKVQVKELQACFRAAGKAGKRGQQS